MGNMKKGLTLIELVVSIAILVIVLAGGLIALDPARQFAQARNSQRGFHINAIINAIRENVANTRTGIFTCASGDIPTSSKRMAVGAGNYDIAPCLVPDYMQILPFDPATTSARYTSATDYDSGYYVAKNASGTITVSAPAAELGKVISVTR
jgi:prepilin-type N-terminal cleavage/methylation domain-containing protein